MSPRFKAPTMDPVNEGSEDDSARGTRGRVEHDVASRHRLYRTRHGPAMSSKSNTAREKEKDRHRKTRQKPGSRHVKKGKDTKARRPTTSSRDAASETLRQRHRRARSSHRDSTSPSSTSSEDEGPVLDHRVVLAAGKARLTSPSIISNLTTLTTITNTSSGSSGSNSTVTQASVSKEFVGKKPEMSQPIPVPDAPDVFAYLDPESDPEEEGDEEESVEGDEEPDQAEADDKDDDDGDDDGDDDESDDGQDAERDSPLWLKRRVSGTYLEAPFRLPTLAEHTESSSSSSSFHGDDNFSEPIAGHDTDRSSSPEFSMTGHDNDPFGSTRDFAADKIACQMQAATHRQSLSGVVQSIGSAHSDVPHVRSTDSTSHSSNSTTLRNFSKATEVIGHEPPASQLSSCSGSETIKAPRSEPVYRRFDALNHRILVHLQDEIIELELEMYRLDDTDPQARHKNDKILHESRRTDPQTHGHLQWYKADLLGRIAYKLSQYSKRLLLCSTLVSHRPFNNNLQATNQSQSIDQALTSLNQSRCLPPAASIGIDHHRVHLPSADPRESETRCLEHTEDLLSVCSPLRETKPNSGNVASFSDSTFGCGVPRSRESAPAVDTTAPAYILPTVGSPVDQRVSALATAIAVAILLPILTFNLIPGFLGRMTVVGIVGGGALGALMQSGFIGRGILGQDGLIYATTWLTVMALIAGVII